jgi:hypothetical protein
MHLGILAHSTEGAALCFLAYCQEGVRRLGRPEHPDVTLDYIFDELVSGVFTDASRQQYVRIIARLAARGCDAAALVCTEIPLLVTPDVAPLPTLDSTRLLARAAYDVAAGHAAAPTWRGGPVRPAR